MPHIRTYLIGITTVLLWGCGGSSDSESPEAPNTTLPEQKSFMISTSLSEGGTITPDSFELAENSEKTFLIGVDQGHELESVSGCDGNMEGDKFTVSNPEKNCTIEVKFKAYQYTVNVTTSLGGWVDSPSYQLSYGESAEININPDSDHFIESVTGCGGTLSEQQYTTDSINADCNIDVKFSSHFPAPAEGIELIRLPVVVHVIENEYVQISDEQIHSQIEATNRHFRALNTEDLESIEDQFVPYIADTGIQLYLANHDPDGNPHSGINRKTAALSIITLDNAYAKAEKGGIDAWPNEQYINVWVGYARDFQGTLGLLGRANIPGFVEDRLIGVVVADSVFGVIPPREPRFDEGKTLTHELGHLFGLIGHTHGVPTDENTHRHLTCDGQPTTQCKNSDLIMNFMNAETDDKDQKMFSISQSQVMEAWFKTGPLQALYLNNQNPN
ncbi:M43 family zinc metalloprotease [Pseudoalteromonas umbrosa]|uniref:M43 family zinc metalloprotease n=1 Tax=Pseudoalteromonas umbrosa TaxID=3048489 RepID=UPI0024C26972|nr:M43 family zinc metalloprotease [Pseudoalteromonas sp. B95]MDK1288413.1 M43 family zinc metalloprotease [Pseudoalteromonas sp. B95]